MALMQFGIQFICDLCGATGNSTAEPNTLRWDQVVRPEGWTAFGHDYNIQFRDAFGAAIEHLCPSCSALSIGGFIERLRARNELTKRSH